MRHMAPTMPLRESRARAEQAAALRAMGYPWRAIADSLGFKSHGAAQLAVARHHQRSPLPSGDMARRTAAQRLNTVVTSLFERFAVAKQDGDDDTLVMLSKEIRNNTAEMAKLHGAYAPQRTEVDLKVSTSETAIIAEARRRLLELDNIVDAEVVAG